MCGANKQQSALQQSLSSPQITNNMLADEHSHTAVSYIYGYADILKLQALPRTLGSCKFTAMNHLTKPNAALCGAT